METNARNYEVLVQETYEALLRAGDIAIDVGAHVGRHSLAMAEQVAPTGRVLAFEPLPMCRTQLIREVAEYYPELASVLGVYPEALSDYSGETEFVVARDALAYSGLRERSYDWPTRVQRIPVQVRTLDELCLELPSLRYLKIDAEGGEYHILKGAVQTLKKFRPVVAFEFGASSSQQYGLTAADMARFWSELGYHVYDILGNLMSEQFLIISARHERLWDYLAIPAENVAVEKTVVEVLRRPPDWHRVTTHLDMAEHNAAVGKAVPRLVGFKGIKRWFAKRVARLVIGATQILTRPQRAFNQALVRCVRMLLRIARHREKENARQAARIAELERTVGQLNQELAMLSQKVATQLNSRNAA